MSVELMAAVWRSSVEGTNNRFLLLALADRADDQGYCHPGRASLMAKTGLSEASVKRSTRFLIESELLRRVSRFTNKGQQRSNYYRINVRRLQELRVAPTADEEHELAGLFDDADESSPEQGGVEGVTQTPSPDPQEIGGVTQTPGSHRPPRGVTQTPLGGSHRPPDTSVDPSKDPVLDSSPSEKSRPQPKKSKIDSAARADVMQICNHLADRIEQNGSKRPAITQRWCDEARRLIDIDGREIANILRLIDWCQNDSFWKPNILSMPTFRAKYDQMRLKANEERLRRRNQRATTSDGVRSALSLAQRYAAEEEREAAGARQETGVQQQLMGTG